jgi:hypothetical protein
MRVGVAHQLSFTVSTITYNVVVFADRVDTLPLFLIYPYRYSVEAKSVKFNNFS